MLSFASISALVVYRTRRLAAHASKASASWSWVSSSSGLSFVVGLVTGILLAGFAEEAVAEPQRLVARERALFDGVLPHRIANLGPRRVGNLLGEPARSKPRFEDP